MKLRKILSAVIAGAAVMPLWGASPKYIFYCIGDGMGPGAVMAAETYNRMVRKSTEPLLMMQFPVASMSTTYSADSPVTDSAAAGTALSSGYKTKNSMLGMNPDTVAVNSITVPLKEAGYGIGLLTNVCPDDATPAAFYAHVPNRSSYYQIGKQAAQSDIEFIGGSRWRGAWKKGKPTDLMKIMAENGVQTARGLDEFSRLTSRRVVLLNTDTVNNNMGHTIDSIPDVLTLADLTKACISHLMKHTPDKFFMMIEGGNIDWSGHANDGGTIVKDVISFDETLRIVYDFYLQHPDETLIVVTADHETGGLSVGSGATGYNAYLKYIDYQKVSKAVFSDWCKEQLKSNRNMTWEEMKAYLTDNFGFWSNVPVSEKAEAALREKFDKTFVKHHGEDQKTLYNSFNEFAVEVFDVMSRVCGFGWTTPNHSGNPVPVYAIGVDAELFGSQPDNTEIPMLILGSALGQKQ
ncbi:MAG: alkaline phosphatase [Muribaculaceae bacterium]|nr:alkaline phosphatase [Muribaculaceae bacterium]